MTTQVNKENQTGMILVIGATGNQGGNVARKLLANGHQVRILVRNPNAPAAQLLAKAGAEVVQGELGNKAAVASSMQGVSGVFSVTVPDLTGGDLESRYAEELVQAALESGVNQFVHTSVSSCDKFPRWKGHELLIKSRDEKWAAEESVRKAGFPYWTILRPTWIMENCTEPLAKFMLPQLRIGKITTALKANTRIEMIAGEDIGTFGCAAFENPEFFNRKHIDLAGDSRSMTEVAAILSRVKGKKVVAVSLTEEEAVAVGLHPASVSSHTWMNEIGYQVDIEALKSYGLPLTTFDDWALKNRDSIIID